jgi:Putative adhesin
MKRLSRPASTAAILGTICGLLAFALRAQAWDHPGALTEELHQTYSIAPDGHIELSNINGDVHISSWDQNTVKLDAVKYADTKEQLDAASIDIDVGRDYISIRTEYPEHDHTFNWGWRNNPASVEYTLKVPQTIRLDQINLVNGALDITGTSPEVRASCVNGRLEAKNLSGEAKLSTVNGRLEASFDQLASHSIELNSVNGGLELTIPSDSNARVEASTVSGGIDNDFGLHVSHHFVGHNVDGELGNGGARIHLADVNGRISIHHAQDGRALSPARDRGKGGDDDSI